MKYKNERQDSADHSVKFAFVDLIWQWWAFLLW